MWGTSPFERFHVSRLFHEYLQEKKTWNEETIEIKLREILSRSNFAKFENLNGLWNILDFFRI